MGKNDWSKNKNAFRSSVKGHMGVAKLQSYKEGLCRVTQEILDVLRIDFHQLTGDKRRKQDMFIRIMTEYRKKVGTMLFDQDKMQQRFENYNQARYSISRVFSSRIFRAGFLQDPDIVAQLTEENENLLGQLQRHILDT